MKIYTKNGHDFFAVSSLLQKSLRRGDVVLAATACIELLPKYANYCWKRLFVVSAEDCDALVTQEIVALHQAWVHVGKSNAGSKVEARREGRIFFAKAIVTLAKCHHSRDQDELLHLIVNRIPASVVEAALSEVANVFAADDGKNIEIPDWVYDKHTARGRREGKTLDDFLHEEHDALVNSSTMFGNFDEMVDTWGYVEPNIDLTQGGQ
jgi:replication-associated recombination protein RarA